MKKIHLLIHFAVTAFSTHALAADSATTANFPPAQCMGQCELAGACELLEFNEFPDFQTTLTEIVSSCQADSLYAVEGACSDGRKLLINGSGYTSEIRLYTSNGEFEGLITQTDVSMPPCMGQSFWPRYLQCESPVVVQKLCGLGFEVGSPAFQSRWNE